MDKERLINLVQMHSVVKLIACSDALDTTQEEADALDTGLSALLKEIETHVPRGEA